jgi:hypothetical protein
MRVVARLAVLSLLVGLCSCSLLRFRSEAGIQASILEKTPVGSSKESVEQYFHCRGYEPFAYGTSPDKHVRSDWSVVVGASSVSRVQLGWYFATFPGFPLITNVYASWEFTPDDRLLGVYVKKEADGL